jgi:GMP synthase-like glutamine amidotransferase
VRLPTALVVQHSAVEDAGRLADWLAAAGLLLDLHRPYDGSPLPSRAGGHAALIVLGGSMGAHDDAVAPWLPATRALLADALAAGVPTLGICLGAQLLAAAAGGRVERGSAGPEIGPGLVAKRDAAAADRLFGPVPFTPDVVHWHWDTVAALPAGAVLLASSTRYPHQAFRVGEHAWAVQFHVETTPEMVRRWAAEDAAELAAEGLDVDALLGRTDLDALHADIAAIWQPFAARFAEVVRAADYARRGSVAQGSAAGGSAAGGSAAGGSAAGGSAAGGSAARGSAARGSAARGSAARGSAAQP